MAKNTAIAAEWTRDEAVRVVEELESLLGRLGANCPENIRQRVLQARREAWSELTYKKEWKKSVPLADWKIKLLNYGKSECLVCQESASLHL